ncbi:hypothetical protein HWV62_30300 [Athelia sp. TMB]|nr:hypothetical protein HWV62_30300 [Athelia sp. TMB]
MPTAPADPAVAPPASVPSPSPSIPASRAWIDVSPAMHSSPAYATRKALPIKRNDAEPLSREDVQYDMLYHIFSDARPVFTSPIRAAANEPPTKVHFCDLYVNALYKSSKCSKVLKDKMVETPLFAVELAKISLLTNVGRINTTMAFFPEMKTALRTYHPVPSLQKTDGNAQDAPRIKNCLKAALLASEIKGEPPSTPDQILEKVLSTPQMPADTPQNAGQRPPTSVVNLIFVLANHAAPLAPTHFDAPLTFLDLFLPLPISSRARARAFLWLMHHYLEGPSTPNPFADEHARTHPGRVPWLHRLEPGEKENIDTKEEVVWGRAMSARREEFLKRLMAGGDEKRGKEKPTAGNGTGSASGAATPTSAVVESISASTSVREPTRERDRERERERERGEREREKEKEKEKENQRERGRGEERAREGERERLRHRAVLPNGEREKPFLHYVPPKREERHRDYPPTRPRHTHSRHNSGHSVSAPRRSLLQHAWQVVSTTDPLLDSDEEMLDETELVRQDYQQRLRVINRLRGRSPTPPPEQEEAPPPDTRKRKPRGSWRRVESWDSGAVGQA